MNNNIIKSYYPKVRNFYGVINPNEMMLSLCNGQDKIQTINNIVPNQH